jgi:CxxC motif-containing protein (DUF1111 family)
MLLTVVPLLYAGITTFDNHTNGFESQGDFEADLEAFQDDDQIADGLGPVYNAQSCAECHANTISGGSSQINELRAGSLDGTTFTDHPGGSLINDRALDPVIQEKVRNQDNVVALRVSLNLLGDGYVEAIPDSEFTRIQNAQPAGLKGTIINVPLLEAPNVTRIGRFGWKNQHASLLSFSADAYRNEVGITSPLQPTENRSNNNSVAAFDTVPDPEDGGTTIHPFGEDVEAFTRLMRSFRVPVQDPDLKVTGDVQAGEELFAQVGCKHCHTANITTAPEGTSFNGGTFIVPAALASKTIHPYSDFMLHDIGTGDGIVQNGGPETRNMIRTAPLWGLRTRTRLMHDGASFTPRDAILRHAGQATSVIQSYSALDQAERQQILAFLDSL